MACIRVSVGSRALALALAGVGCMGFAPISAPAWVQNALTLGRRQELQSTPKVARFTDDQGGGFVLDRSRSPALLKFDDSAEVWAVSASRGPRGDVLFKDDVGEILLRVTKLGGVTAFTAHRPMGVAASLAGSAGPLRLGAVDAQGLYQRMLIASSRCSRVAHHLVAFEAPDVDDRTAAPIADAVLSAMDGVIELASRPDGRHALARLMRVTFAASRSPAAWWRGGVLSIDVNPGEGLSGHPSSARIAQVLEGS